ncbi:MAG: hypothetical protein ACI8QZ_004031 [Chlamydiales bacterium]|jgi:hypothetical protein
MDSKKTESRRTLMKRLALGLAAIVVAARLPANAAGGGQTGLPPAAKARAGARANRSGMRRVP